MNNGPVTDNDVRFVPEADGGLRAMRQFWTKAEKLPDSSALVYEPRSKENGHSNLCSRRLYSSASLALLSLIDLFRRESLVLAISRTSGET